MRRCLCQLLGSITSNFNDLVRHTWWSYQPWGRQINFWLWVDKTQDWSNRLRGIHTSSRMSNLIHKYILSKFRYKTDLEIWWEIKILIHHRPGLTSKDNKTKAGNTYINLLDKTTSLVVVFRVYFIFRWGNLGLLWNVVEVFITAAGALHTSVDWSPPDSKILAHRVSSSSYLRAHSELLQLRTPCIPCEEPDRTPGLLGASFVKPISLVVQKGEAGQAQLHQIEKHGVLRNYNRYATAKWR